MREAAFVRQNKEKWIAFEKALDAKTKISADRLADLYTQLTNDLAYAQTYYKDSKTLEYLNSLASQAHQSIYRNKKETKNRFLTFWVKECPRFIARYHSTLLYALIIFLFAGLVGVISSIYDEGFVRLILGDGYVNMTMENIRDGNPTGVYQDDDAFAMFVNITLNNIRVGIICFAFGIITSIGSAYILFSNGVMVGSFLTLFYNEGVLYEATKVVWLHGTIELSIIVICGGAGMIMGNSILFPKTYSRRVSFVRGAKSGLKILVSTFPLFIVAGFIEGFITRYADMPDALAFSIIFLSATLILGYYLVYPLMLKQTHE